jgi:hypothetical protein
MLDKQTRKQKHIKLQSTTTASPRKALKATKVTYSEETRHISSKTRRPGSQGKEFTTSKIAPEANEN